MDPNATGSQYDRIATWYHERVQNSVQGLEHLRRALRLLPSTGEALDVGCGAGGRMIQALREAGHRVTGIDVSIGMLEIAWCNPGLPSTGSLSLGSEQRKGDQEMKKTARWGATLVCMTTLLSITVLHGSRVMYGCIILAGCSLVALGFLQTSSESKGRKFLIGGLSVGGVAAGLIAAYLCRT